MYIYEEILIETLLLDKKEGEGEKTVYVYIVYAMEHSVAQWMAYRVAMKIEIIMINNNYLSYLFSYYLH